MMLAKTKQTSTRSFDLTPLESFNGQNLPTNSDVLKRFFLIKDNLENKSEKVASLQEKSMKWKFYTTKFL